jgi:poly(ADP-ribose) glycohydrolase ARH3
MQASLPLRVRNSHGPNVGTDRFEGCLLGLALGDALGACYEGGLAERILWSLIGSTKQGHMRWTDDTQMSVDIAESLVAKGEMDADDLALRFAGSYRWNRGYGPSAAKLLKRIAGGADWRQANRWVHPEGSYGNGAVGGSSPPWEHHGGERLLRYCGLHRSKIHAELV